MGAFKSIEEARKFFEQDRFAYENGVRLDELTDEGAVCSLELTARHRNAMGGVMGGAIFTLADLAFAAASNHLSPGTVALDVTVNYLSAAKGDTLTARSVCVRDGGSTCVHRVTVTDDTGREIAVFTGTGFKTKKKG